MEYTSPPSLPETVGTAQPPRTPECIARTNSRNTSHITPSIKTSRADDTDGAQLSYTTPIHAMAMILYDCEDCAICLNPLDNFDPTLTTRCKHTFHRACLLQSKSLCKSECPMCRTKLTPPSNGAVRSDPATRVGREGLQDENGLSSVSDLSSRMAIAAAARRGRNAVRQAMQRRNNLNSSPVMTSA